MKIVAFLLIVGAAIALALGMADHFKRDDQLQALRDTVRITDSVEVVKWDTVIVHQRRVDTVKARSDALDAQVVVVDDSTLSITADPSFTDSVKRADSVKVPPLVVADLKALRLTVAEQDTLIHALYSHDTTQHWRIATRDKLYAAEIKKANAPRWGIGATCGLDPFDRSARCVIGLSYQAKLPSPKQLLKALVR